MNCPDCHGEGLVWAVGSSFHDGPCPTCDGAGYCVDSLTFPPEQIGQPCPDCTPETCTRCHGARSILRYDRTTLEPVERIDCPDCTPPFRANPNITWDQMPWELRPKK